VGAGLAGLCAAHELDKMGYTVTVYEARDRVGGRVASDTGFSKGKVVERGAELIGSNHPLWRAYAKEFGLEFLDTKDYGDAPIRMGGHTLTFEETHKLTDAFDTFKDELDFLASTIVDPFEPWSTPHAEALDQQSLGGWLDGLRCPPEQRDGREAVRQQLVADNGVAADAQSLLGVLAMIKGHGLDRYWEETEVWRCDGGNQQLATQLRDALPKGTVHTNTAVTALSSDGPAVRATLGNAKTGVVLGTTEVHDVILAVPPSVWHRIAFTDPELHARLAGAPQLGSNIKALMRFDRRFWKDFASSPTLSSDTGPADLTWETSEDDKDKDPSFTMVAFAGAAHADALVRLGSDAARQQTLLTQLEVPYPGITAALKGFEFENWPEDKWSGGSYYFPRCGEITRWGRFWKSGYSNWLHFAGEHTCYAFMGYMEGALESGYRLAWRLAERDGILR